MAHHQGHVKVIVVVQTLQIFVRARTEAGKREKTGGMNEAALVRRLFFFCGSYQSSPVPQSHQCVLMKVRRPFLVSGDCSLGHAKRFHAVGAGMVSDVVVQLVSCNHPRGDGEAP